MPLPERCAGVEVCLSEHSSSKSEPRLGELYQAIDCVSDLGLAFIDVVSPFDECCPSAWDALALDVDPLSIEDLDIDLYNRETERAFSVGPLDTSQMRALKLDLLWFAFQKFWETHWINQTGRAAAFRSFIEQEACWMKDYCLFRLLADLENGEVDWRRWDVSYQDYPSAIKFLARLRHGKEQQVEKQLNYYAYVQWIAARQWSNLRQYADHLGVILMTDVDLLQSTHSIDEFARPSRSAAQRRIFDDFRSRLQRYAQVFSIFRIADLGELSVGDADLDVGISDLITRWKEARQSSRQGSARHDAWECIPGLSLTSSVMWSVGEERLPIPLSGYKASFCSESTKSSQAIRKSEDDSDRQEFDLLKILNYPARAIQLPYAELKRNDTFSDSDCEIGPYFREAMSASSRLAHIANSVSV